MAMRMMSPDPPPLDAVATEDHRKLPELAASQNETCEMVSVPVSVNSGCCSSRWPRLLLRRR